MSDLKIQIRGASNVSPDSYDLQVLENDMSDHPAVGTMRPIPQRRDAPTAHYNFLPISLLVGDSELHWIYNGSREPLDVPCEEYDPPQSLPESPCSFSEVSHS